MRIAVIGAGLSGLACAAALQEAGHRVAVFEKSAGVGGRMSTRRMDTAGGEATFDHGAPYFTAGDPGFRAVVGRWQAAGLAAPWPAAGAQAWVGTPTMTAPARHLAATLDVRRSQRILSIDRQAEGWQLQGETGSAGLHDAAIVALPAEQASVLLGPVSRRWSERADATPSAPCWTVMASFVDRLPIPVDMVEAAGAIGWAARNSAKPGRTGPEAWVVQAAPGWSREHLEDDAASVSAALPALLGALLGADLPDPVSVSAHRWRYARSGSAGCGHLWEPANRLGVCGDWLLGAQVEDAWRSGVGLAAAIGAAG